MRLLGRTLSRVEERVMSENSLQVVNNKALSPRIPAELVELEGNYNFKPYIAELPDGEILMSLSHTHDEEAVTGGTLTVHPVTYRSADGGRTWGGGRHVPEMVGGHEPAVTVIDGVVFVTAHFGKPPRNDPIAGHDHFYNVIYRSEDAGRTFEALDITAEFLGDPDEDQAESTRNLLRLRDGRIILGVDCGMRSYLLLSDDLGKSWKSRRIETDGVSWQGAGRSCLMSESVLFFSPSGRLMMLSRLDYTQARFDRDLPLLPDYHRKTGLDQFDGEVLFEADGDLARWKPLRAVGFPALMYPSIVDLGGPRQLFTFTVREIPPANSGCIHPKVGVQAAIVEERSDGFMDFRLDEDLIVIDDCTPASQRNAGCFGNTIKIADGTLVTPFSFPIIDPEILQLADNKAYLDAKVFNHYAEMQSTYSFRYEDFVQDDKELMEMMLRRWFSALFLYARCANKGGIGTRVVRWRV